MQDKKVRFHYLDQVRAHMMLLGILYHLAPLFMSSEIARAGSLVDSIFQQGLFGMVVGIHLFRMPVFFIVAGFFCMLVLDRWGPHHLAKDRFQRILLPFALLLGPAFVICHSILVYKAELFSHQDGYVGPYEHFEPDYFWFLYFLAIYYTVVLLTVCLLPELWRKRLRVFVTGRPFWQLFLGFGAVVSVATVLLDVVFIPAPISWKIDWRILLYFAAFFGLGMALYGHKFMIRYQSGLALKLFLLLLLTIGGILLFYSAKLNPDHHLAFVIHPLWNMIFGFAAVIASLFTIAIYQRFLSRESALARYIADSSYWVYLVHFPIAMAMPVVFYPWSAPLWTQFLAAVVLTSMLSLLSYHFFVRTTWVGLWLNGKKYKSRTSMNIGKRSLPAKVSLETRA